MSKFAIAAWVLWVGALCFAHEGEAHTPGGTAPEGFREVLDVQNAQAGSPAARAGLRPGDRLLRVNDRPIEGLESLREVLAACKPGQTIPVVVQRDGEEIVSKLTLAERQGGASMGVALEIGYEAVDGVAPENDPRDVACFGWIEETYGIESRIESLGLELSEEWEELRTCIVRDMRRMSLENATRFCENVFKAHCSGTDLLTEIGEAQVDRCEELLGDEVTRGKGWKTCAQHKVFDDYVKQGEWTEASCRAALRGRCSEHADRSSANPHPHRAPVATHAGPQEATWRQWGGPRRDFRAPAAGLAATWPDGGPARLWTRSLGEGASAILFDSGRLYTMYRTDGREVVVSLDAATGETLWEHRYDGGPHPEHVGVYGEGPQSTPLIAGDLLFSVGMSGRMHALRKETGKVVWTRELWEGELGGRQQGHGYSSSPIAYGASVILPVGGEDAGLVAFDQRTGAVKWKTAGFRNSYSSPRLVELGGRRQLMLFTADALIGVDPDHGEILWNYPHSNQWGSNITVPEVLDGERVFLSSPQIGARGLRVARAGEPKGPRDGAGNGSRLPGDAHQAGAGKAGETGKANPSIAAFQVEEVWAARRVQFYHATSVRDGDWVYGSTGMSSPAFMIAVNARTGEIGWKKRGIGKANCVEADGKLVILDENGVLYLASATPEDFVVHAQTQLLDGVSWTVPTIVGRTLYARDRQQIVAVDLGRVVPASG